MNTFLKYFLKNIETITKETKHLICLVMVRGKGDLFRPLVSL